MASVSQIYPSDLVNDCSVERKREEEEDVGMTPVSLNYPSNFSDPLYDCSVERMREEEEPVRLNYPSDLLNGCSVERKKEEQEEDVGMTPVRLNYPSNLSDPLYYCSVERMREEDIGIITPVSLNYPSNIVNSLNDCSVERKKHEEENIRIESEPSYPFLVEAKDLTIPRSAGDRYLEACYSDPLIEVASVEIWPSPLEVEVYQSFSIYGEIYVDGSDGKKVVIYKRTKRNPQPITSQGPTTLLLTTPSPVRAVIKMDRLRKMFINLKVQGVCFAEGSLSLKVPPEPGYHKNKSQTLSGNLGDVKVDYICMPFARIGRVSLTFTEQGQRSHVSSSPDAHISGKITTHYDSHVYRSPLILFHKERAQLHYGVPVNLCRSLVCVPCCSVISFKLEEVELEFVGREGKHKRIVYCEDVKFSDPLIPKFVHKLPGNLHVTVEVHWFTTCELEANKPFKDASTWRSVARLLSPPPIRGDFRVQVLSVFVGHGGNEQVDICGTVAVDHSCGSCYLFKADYGRPRTFIGKAPTMKGVTSYYPGDTSYHGDYLSVVVKLNDVGREHVDIENSFVVNDFVHYYPGKWFDTPLCHVLLGKQGFAAVHFILFDSAVKATMKITVVLKDSNAPCPSGSVSGTLVARYSNLGYLTKYQRKYWSIHLLQVKYEQRLSEDGEISLLRDVISVPEGSSLMLYADLYVSSGSVGTYVDHIVNKVKIRIGDAAPSRIKGKTYDVVVRTKWESGWSL